MLTNPVVLAELSLCILCLFKVNVLLSMLISLFIGGVAGGLGVTGTLSSMLGGLGGNVCSLYGLHRYHNDSF